MGEFNLQDYAAMRELEQKNTKGWGSTTAMWVIAAVIVIAFFVYLWQQGCNEKVMFATGLAKLDGRVDAIEPAVTAQGNNLYKLNGVTAATVQGVKDMRQSFADDIFNLNDAVFYSHRHRAGCGCDSCGNREFRQTSTYKLASQAVTVDETCRN